MSEFYGGSNPYDFRTPTQGLESLAGRPAEIEELDELLRGAPSRAVFCLILGESAIGKTSFLNAAYDVAQRRGLVPFRLQLRNALVESDLSFFQGMYEAVLQVLLDRNVLTPNDALLKRWIARTTFGLDEPTVSDDDLELALVIAAKLNGRMVGQVATQLVVRDLVRLQQLIDPASDTGRLLLCVDNAEIIDRNRDLGPAILEICEQARISLVATSTNTADLQQASPRSWAQIEMKPFSSPYQVIDAVIKPLERREAGSITPSIPTAIDILQLTGGAPYEVMLVCHYIWHAMQRGDQETFELSSGVIDSVLEELHEQGRHESESLIVQFSRLTADDYRMLVDVAPYEALTTRQMALLRLMLDPFDEDELSRSVQDQETKLRHLAQAGVVSFEQGRFEIRGGHDGRVYLKYAAKRNLGRKLRFGDSYHELATRRVSSMLAESVLGRLQDGDARLFSRSSPFEIGGLDAGDLVEGLHRSIGERDITSLAELLGPAVSGDWMVSERTNNPVYVGLLIKAGIHEVEIVEILDVGQPDTTEDLDDAIRQWAAEHRDLMAMYELEILDFRCSVVPRSLLREVGIYASLVLLYGISFVMYCDGARSSALALVESGLKLATQVLDGEAAHLDPLLRTQISEGHHRAGFMVAAERRFAEAETYLNAARALAMSDNWLLDFNRAFVMMQNNPLGAVKLYESAAALCNVEQEVVLHGYFPTPDGWDSEVEDRDTVDVRGPWVRRFVLMQLAVAQAAADGRAELLEEQLRRLDTSAPPPILRMAAWAQLTIFNRPDEAAALFDTAAERSRYDRSDLPRREALFARTVARR